MITTNAPSPSLHWMRTEDIRVEDLPVGMYAVCTVGDYAVVEVTSEHVLKSVANRCECELEEYEWIAPFNTPPETKCYTCAYWSSPYGRSADGVCEHYGTKAKADESCKHWQQL